MNLLYRACVVVGIVSACVPPDDHALDITFDPCEVVIIEAPADATSAERASIEDAIHMWNAVSATGLTTDTALSGARLPVHFQTAALAFFGVYDDEIGEVFINRDLADPRERSVAIAHEVGHAFGLLHVNARERISVMNPANIDVVPTLEDGKALVSGAPTCLTIEAP